MKVFHEFSVTRHDYHINYTACTKDYGVHSASLCEVCMHTLAHGGAYRGNCLPFFFAQHNFHLFLLQDVFVFIIFDHLFSFEEDYHHLCCLTSPILFVPSGT